MSDTINDNQSTEDRGAVGKPAVMQRLTEQRWRPGLDHDAETLLFRHELKVKGHVLVEDEDGYVDEGAYYEEGCHGPRCKACGLGFCDKCWGDDEPIVRCASA